MIVGLTGGIASGKTFCSDYLHNQYDAAVVDADVIAREVVQPGSEGLSAIVTAFGAQVLNTQGALDRAKLRAMMLADDAVREALNTITHPRIRTLMLERIEQSAGAQPYQILSVPLLFENHLHLHCQAVVVIDVDEATQLTRAMARDGAEESAIRRMLAAQLSRFDRLRQTNFVIDNGGSRQASEQQLDRLHDQLLLLAS
ncbi:dephospho-CoA kinase [Suttonella sp. R2A3]|uniref:dephospho-CoA kinase n=1 Tax=Suttonella sp. R2A3 TaxID=2908648 RepID=UPI001EE9F75D|nr:dephospho-CoA kinase [Suttonella sp. R2A3]UJF23708.1 dephospho-CoA kinase [Suttonella sp. R2A3]